MQKYLHVCIKFVYLHPLKHIYTLMKVKNNRIETLKMLISSKELGSQEELLQALLQEGFKLTQATLSRDLKQLNVAETMYKRVRSTQTAREMLESPGYLSINFSGNLGVIKTRPGYASLIAYNIDNADMPDLLGTVAGDDTILLIIKEGSNRKDVIQSL